MKTNKRDMGFDIIRSISALWIVCVWHLLAYAEPAVNYVIPSVAFCAELALSCFMFISGYFLGQKTITNIEEVWAFYKKRFWRFYILYLISACILLVGGIMADKAWFQTPWSFYSTILGFSSFVDPSVGTIWFMSMLMLFYILTPLILYRNKSVVKRLMISAIIFILFITLYFLLPSVDFRLLRFFPLYALGLMMNNHAIVKFKDSFLVAILSFIVCALLITLPFNIGNEYISVIVSNLLYVLKYFSAILLLIWCIDKIKLSEGGKLYSSIEFISYISLALYLFHRPVFQVLTMIINGLNKRGIIGFGSNLWVLYLFYVPIVIVVSYFIEKIYDKLLIKVR